jgi:hypothetical protein
MLPPAKFYADWHSAAVVHVHNLHERQWNHHPIDCWQSPKSVYISCARWRVGGIVSSATFGIAFDFKFSQTFQTKKVPTRRWLDSYPLLMSVELQQLGHIETLHPPYFLLGWIQSSYIHLPTSNEGINGGGEKK